MHTYLKRFEAMVEALRAHPEITVTEFEVKPPATEEQLAAARAYWPLDADMEAFYRQCNGIKLAWTSAGRDNDADGSVRIWGVQDTFCDQRDRIYWEDDDAFKPLHPVDHFSDEACAALFLKPGEPAVVYYHYCGEEMSSMQVDFRGYLELLLKSRGFWYWQRAIAAPEYFNEYHPRGTNELNFRKYAKELFSDYRDSDFVRVDQAKIDALEGGAQDEKTDETEEAPKGERRRIIEGTWTCASCEQGGLRGRLKRCPFCGSAREEGTGFDFGARDAKSGRALAATVVDAEGLQMAAAGADWFCANCDSANPAASAQCGGCGSSAEYAALSAPLPPPEPPSAPPPPPAKAAGGGAKAAGLGCGLLTILGIFAVICLIGIFWATRTTTSTGEVTGVEWTSQVHLERWTATPDKGWRDDVKTLKKAKAPVGGKGEVIGISELRSCQDKVRKEAGCETKTKQEACGTEEKCTQKDLGNGFAEEVCKDITKYCSVEYEDCWQEERGQWCAFDRYDWKRIDTHELKGTTNEPKPAPSFEVGVLDRTTSEQHLRVDVRYGDEKGSWKTKDLARFRQLTVGTPVEVDVANVGGIQDVRPVK